MLSHCLCQVHKCLFLRNLKLNLLNVVPLARRIHSSAKKLSDCELKERTLQNSETEELPQSTENSNLGRLHIPVMLEEVVNCLSPQPGQDFSKHNSLSGVHHFELDPRVYFWKRTMLRLKRQVENMQLSRTSAWIVKQLNVRNTSETNIQKMCG